MSLMHCPECGHEISTAAVACPNCGRPISAVPVVEQRPVVATAKKSDGVPNWIFIPLGIIGAVLLIVFFVVMSRNSDDNSNLSVNVNSRRPAGDLTRTNTDIPSSNFAVNATQNLTIPGSQTQVSETKGTVVIDAKVATPRGTPQPVRNEKFYLLDKDLESILAEARLQPIEGQTLLNSLGLSVIYPERYGDFNRDALRAIRDHIKYSGTTDTSGRAQLGGIEPDSYHLFAITRSGRGFAIWSEPVSINPGENAFNLTPQRVTEMEISPTGD